MKKYVAIALFEDLQDNNTRYNPGTLYPREGLDVSEDRIQSLLTGSNIQGRRLIAELVEVKQKGTEGDREPDKIDSEETALEAKTEKKATRSRKKKDTE